MTQLTTAPSAPSAAPSAAPWADPSPATPASGRTRRAPTDPTTVERDGPGSAGSSVLADRLGRARGPVIEADERLWGFGGLHGGLALAELTAALGEVAGDGARLRSVTGQFLRPLRDDAEVVATALRRGRSTATAQGRARTAAGDALVATATFGTGRGAVAPLDPPPPPVPPPHALGALELGDLAPPFVSQLEIRPVGDALPFAGGEVPELTAWVRLVGAGDRAPDELQLVLLTDALAPSYAAVLATPAMLPTVELTVRPTPTRVAAASPWVLLRTTTTSVSPDGWVVEHIDLWDVDGQHLAVADQLRLLLAW